MKITFNRQDIAIAVGEILEPFGDYQFVNLEFALSDDLRISEVIGKHRHELLAMERAAMLPVETSPYAKARQRFVNMQAAGLISR